MLRYETYSLRRRGRSRRLARWLTVLALVLVFHALLARLAVFSLRIDSVSMQPALAPGDCVLASPLAFGVPLRFAPFAVREYASPRRGDLVVFEVPGYPQRSWLGRLGESLVRALTLQRRSLQEKPGGTPMARFSVKRVIGVPGDTIRMERLHAFVRPAGHQGFQPEEQVVSVAYRLVTEAYESWPAELPFGGDMDEVTLGEQEYFLLADNRAHGSDSRSWGVVDRAAIRGKVVFRYWPVRRIGPL